MLHKPTPRNRTMGRLGRVTLFILGIFLLPMAQANQENIKTRVLHFPEDRSLGTITLQDKSQVRKIEDYLYWSDGLANHLEYLGPARGDVTVPADKLVHLEVHPDAINDLSPLNNLKPDDLYELSLRFLPAKNRCIPYITHLTGLKGLDLYGTQITMPALKEVAKLKSLEELTPPGILTDDVIYYLCQIRSLKRLYIIESRLTDKGLNSLSKLTDLEELAMSSQNAFGPGLANLSKLPRLNYILFGKGISDAGMEHIRQIPSLRILCFYDALPSDVTLNKLSGHQTLERLAIFRGNITNQGLIHLGTLPSLKMLNLYNESKVTDSGMGHLGRIKTLETLELPSISDKGLASIAQLDNLNKLEIYGCPENSNGDLALKHLSNLQSLEHLFLPGNNYTDSGMDHLVKLVNLKFLSLTSDHITDAGLAKLKSLKSLETLHISLKSATISGLSAINECTHISVLRLADFRQDNSGMDISGLINLENLTIKPSVTKIDKERIYDTVRDEDLKCLEHLNKLKVLQVAQQDHLDITDAGISYLEGLTNIDFLNIGSPNLTDKSFSYIKTMKNIGRLQVSGNFTDSALRELEGLQKLSTIKISTTGSLSETAIQRLKETLPRFNPQYSSFQQNKKYAQSSSVKTNKRENTLAPLFNLKSIDGKDIKLADYRGKVVVLYFWATWCAPCISQTPDLKTMYDGLKAESGDAFELISISLDDTDYKVKEHINKHNLIWPQVRIGRNSQTGSDYHIGNSAPHSFLIGPEGKILLAPESPQVDTKSYIMQVLDTYKKNHPQRQD